MFNAAKYQSMYNRFLGPLARPVQVLVSSDGEFISYAMTGHVTKYRESDLVPGGSIQLGDLKLIMLYEDFEAFGITKLELKDRINIDDRTYSIVHWDEYSRSVGEKKIAVEITIRGGGMATIASRAVFRIIGTGDQRITGDGDRRIIREAV